MITGWGELAVLPGNQDPEWAQYREAIFKYLQAMDPEVRGAHEKMIELAIKKGIHPRAEIGSYEHARTFIDMGVRHFCIGWDMFSLAGWCRQQKEGIKELLSSL